MGAYADFKTRLSNTIRRGSIYDADLDAAIKDAVIWLENNNSYLFMWLIEDQTLAAATDPPRLTLSNPIKSIRFARFKDIDGVYHYKSKVKAEDVSQRLTGEAAGFYYASQTQIEFDNIADVAYDYEIGYYKKSSYQSDTMFWITDAPAILEAKVIDGMKMMIRDTTLIALADAVLAKQLPVLMDADVEEEYDGQDAVMSPFSREIRNDFE